jgi:hypothetical protein
MPRINRRKSIRTPPDRSKVSPSRRVPLPDDGGPTDYQLQRKAEVIGEGTYCRVDDRRVAMTGGKGAMSRAEFASSSALALLLDRGLIESHQYRAGMEYARLHRLIFGASTPGASGLSKVLATALPERIEAINRAAREQLDDESYIEWQQEQRTLYERGEYRLRHMPGSATARRNARISFRLVVIDNLLPAQLGQVARLRHVLNELADVWGIE